MPVVFFLDRKKKAIERQIWIQIKRNDMVKMTLRREQLFLLLQEKGRVGKLTRSSLRAQRESE